MTSRMNRRRFLTISAAAVVLPFGAQGVSASVEWRGIALGAGASMKLTGLNGADASQIFRAVENEISRLESIFSLYLDSSALSQLNRTGRLDAPPPELLEVLTLAGAVNASTGGAFDPTVQPLWMAYANSIGSPDVAALEAAFGHIGWSDLRFAPDAVYFNRPGMALTLNGIAQGYITDRIAALLRARDLGDVLIDMGEIAGLGQRPEGGPWKAGIATPDGQIVQRVTLSDRALATSAPLGTVLDTQGAVGHIIDPLNGGLANFRSLISVTADSAALADALSTAFCVMGRPAIDKTLRTHRSARLENIA